MVKEVVNNCISFTQMLFLSYDLNRILQGRRSFLTLKKVKGISSLQKSNELTSAILNCKIRHKKLKLQIK